MKLSDPTIETRPAATLTIPTEALSFLFFATLVACTFLV